MSKKCAKCEKTVYPAEELKCLDKSWHKVCFKCWDCGMALNMKNYKGFNKLPYCSAHYPQLSATVVVDTPEQRRLTQATNMQSQAVYHADFVNNIRGTVTSMPEDNETRRAKEVGNIVSQAAYTRQRQQGGEEESYNSSTRGGGVGETSYTRPMRSYNEEDSHPDAPRSYMPPAQNNPNIGRMLPVPSATQPTSPLLQQQLQEQQRQQQQQQQQRLQQQQQQQRQQQQQQQRQPSGPSYVAMYDYDAQDEDEVSFVENDRVINCEVVDEGWVVGTIQRTGQRGMIPANYIEQA